MQNSIRVIASKIFNLAGKLNTYALRGSNWCDRLFKLSRGKNHTDCFFSIKNNFIFSKIITTNIHKVLEATEAGTKTHINHQQTVHHSQPYLPEYVTSSDCSRSRWKLIKVSQAANRHGFGIPPLSYPVGYSHGRNQLFISGGAIFIKFHSMTSSCSFNRGTTFSQTVTYNNNIVFLPADTKSIVQTHTFCTTLVNKNRQNRTI